VHNKNTTVGLHVYGGTGGIDSVASIIESSFLSEQFNIARIQHPIHGRSYDTKTIRDIASQIRSVKPCLLHMSGLQGEGAVAMLAAYVSTSAPRLLSVHGFAKDLFFANTAKRNFVRLVLEPLTVYLADAVYCVSEYGAKQKVIERYARRNLGVIHNAVRVFPISGTSRRRRCEFGLNDNDVVGICVSRLTRAKGLLVLCEAMAQLIKSSNNTLKLLIVGDGPERDLIHEMFMTKVGSDHVVFTGNRRDVRELIDAADFFVLPSLNENLSMSILEAMERSKPVISTLAGGTPEAVIHGETGLLVPAGDATALSKAMQWMTREGSQRQILGQAGRRRIIEHFGVEQFARQIEMVYSEMIQMRGTVRHTCR
jgi:glycosyltransferase involved in cell wall biosynthesis